MSTRLSAVFATDSSNRSVLRLPLLSGNTSEEGASAEVLHLLAGDRPRGIALLDTEGSVPTARGVFLSYVFCVFTCYF